MPGARMALLNFKSNVARVGEDRTDDAFVDSGATHHFFHTKSKFIDYKWVETAAVKTAEGVSHIVGKGTIKIKINGQTELTIEAFHAPDFSSNILASHLLSEFYEVLMTSTFGPKECILFQKGSFDIENAALRIPCDGGIYSFREHGQILSLIHI